jgi:hypothetical protein
MSHPSWPSVVWQFYSWDYEPNASLFGAMKAAEPAHIQMNRPDGQVAIVNHGAEPISGATATATLYGLDGAREQSWSATLTAPANAVTSVFKIDWPASGARFALLELRDQSGRLLSDNFYWHARREEDLRQLNTLPQVALDARLRLRHGVLTARISNPGRTPALAVRLTLRDARTQERILPAYYNDDFISLLPG